MTTSKPTQFTVLPEDVADYARTLDTDILICRDWRHSWNILGGVIRDDGRERHWSVPCERCGTVRTRITHTGTHALLGNRYVYPEGYRMEGLGRLSKRDMAVLRAELDRRIPGTA